MQRYEKSPTFTSRGHRFPKMFVLVKHKMYSRCKGKHFFRVKQALFLFSHFSRQSDGNRPWAAIIDIGFPALGPELTSRRVAIWVVFRRNSTTSDDKSPCLSAFQGCGARKERPTAGSAAPTALRSRGNCPLLSSGICKDFLLVAIAALCRYRTSQTEPHPRSWPAIGHRKASTFT